MTIKKVLFLGETYRADAITWMNGVREFTGAEIITWELKSEGKVKNKVKRWFEALVRLAELRKLIIRERPQLILAERITSYGFIGSLFSKYAPIVVAQQGVTDIYPPGSMSVPLKLWMQHVVFKRASLIHAWGNVMTYSMLRQGCNPAKIMVRAKGIDLKKFTFESHPKPSKLIAIVTRSLTEDYRHETILKAFQRVKSEGIDFKLIIVGSGHLESSLKKSAKIKNIDVETIFTGRINNDVLPDLLKESDLYISMPVTEGVSSSLFEAMACGCYPIVSKLPGTRAFISDYINGRLINIDDATQLAEAIVWYWNNRETLDHVRLQNRKMVDEKANFSINMQIIAQKYHALCAE